MINSTESESAPTTEDVPPLQVQIKKEPESAPSVIATTPTNEEAPATVVRIKSEPSAQCAAEETAVEPAVAENVPTTSESQELVAPPTSDVNLNEFFSDLLEPNQEPTATTTTSTTTISAENEVNGITVKQETIPSETTVDASTINDDFFNDLLDEPPPTEPLEALPVEQLEVKFSHTLRELESLESAGNGRGTKRPLVPDTVQAEADKRPRIGTIRVASVGSLTAATPPPPDLPTSPVIRVKSEFAASAPVECLPVVHHNQTPSTSQTTNSPIIVDPSRIKCEGIFNEVENFGDGVEMSIKLKREMALKRVAATKELFKKNSSGVMNILHTDTVRKLPSNATYLTQEFYDNRSPLHTTNNVHFKFNSPYTTIRLQEWGLERLSPPVAHVARTIGYDAYVLSYKRQITDITKLLLRQGQGQDDVENMQEDMDLGATMASSLFIDASTQTALVGPVFGKPPKKDSSNVTTQTIGPQTAVGGHEGHAAGLLSARVQNFPHLKKVHKLNDNQLLALNDFTELMEQQDIAADVYRLRECLLQIFHRSQMPPVSANHATQHVIPTNVPQIPVYVPQATVPPPPPAFNHSLLTNNLNNGHHFQQQPQAMQPQQQHHHYRQPPQQQQQQRQHYVPPVVAHNHLQQQQRQHYVPPVAHNHLQQQQQQSRNIRHDPRIRAQNQRERY